MKMIKKVLLLLCVIVIATMSVTISSCTRVHDYVTNIMFIDYDHVEYRLVAPGDGYHDEAMIPDEIREWGEKYYAAGVIEEYDEAGNPITVQFIPAEINGIPVFKLGFTSLFTLGGMAHRSSTLDKLYAPGTIVNIIYEYVGDYYSGELSFFYCGKAIDLYIAAGRGWDETLAIYVPNERYSEFVALLCDTTDMTLNKANISYRLNADELTEYYYVDYVEYGEQIVNIPPEPTRSGYTFGGWYTESDCINPWSFDNALPKLAEGEDFKELCLYAKWIKK